MYNIFQTYLATLSKSRLTSNSRRTRQYCSKTDEVNLEKEKEIERITKNASLDEPPTACCRSGCANCVFIVWAEALASKMQDAGPEIAEKIMKMVDDPSMRAYLELELRGTLREMPDNFEARVVFGGLFFRPKCRPIELHHETKCTVNK